MTSKNLAHRRSLQSIRALVSRQAECGMCFRSCAFPKWFSNGWRGIVYGCCYLHHLKKKRRTRWSKDWLLKRKQFSHVNLVKELSLEPTDWRNYLRMDEESYFNLLEMITPMIKKQDTVMRQNVTLTRCWRLLFAFWLRGVPMKSWNIQQLFPLHRWVISYRRLAETMFTARWCMTEWYMFGPRFHDTRAEWRDIAPRCFPHTLSVGLMEWTDGYWTDRKSNQSCRATSSTSNFPQTIRFWSDTGPFGRMERSCMKAFIKPTFLKSVLFQCSGGRTGHTATAALPTDRARILRTFCLFRKDQGNKVHAFKR
jgi:hypothetical protein